MAIIVTHSKVSTVPDGDDTSVVRPSDWNDDHVLVGVGTAASLDAGVANGVATLDGTGKVPVSELPTAVLGALSYQGTWNASTNTPTLTSSVGTKGYYYVVSVAGNTNLNGITDWQIGDWAVYNGSVWQKVDNTDAGGDVVGPASATDYAIARFDGTTGKLIQNSGVIIDDLNNVVNPLSVEFSGAIPSSPNPGTLWFDASTDTLNLQQNAITQQIGEEIFVYGKASAAITDSPLQIIYHTGAVGASGVVTFAPTIAGITDENAIIGVATENIPLNGFGRITSFGVVHGITTNGAAFGETWADDDVIWYNPVTGNPTKVKPSAPNIKFQIGTVINAGSGGSGSFQVNLVQGTALGGTDSNVQITSPTAAQLLTYSTTSGYWKNTNLAAGTGISVGNATSGVITVTNNGVTSAVAGTGISVSSATGAVTVTNTAPDQTVAISSGTGISVSGTYPNFTVTNTAPSSGGTVTSVSGTAPVSVATGTTTPVISMAAANTSTNGYLTSTDWNTFNGKQPAGNYVISVSGTTGRITSSGGITPAIDLASGIATAGTTGSSTLIPVITVDTYGRVTSVTTAANPQGTVTSVTGTAPVVSSGGSTPAISMAAATSSVNGYLTSTDWSTFNGKQAALVSGSNIKTVNGTSLLGSGDVGTISVSYGGTGLTSLTANRIPYGNGTSAFNSSANFTYDGSVVNIGGTGGGNTLNLWGTNGVGVRIANTSTGNSSYITSNASDVLAIQSNSVSINFLVSGGVSKIYARGSNGYVGINNSSPAYQLDVVGNGNFTTSLYAGTTLTYGTTVFIAGGNANSLTTCGAYAGYSVSNGPSTFPNPAAWILIEVFNSGYSIIWQRCTDAPYGSNAVKNRGSTDGGATWTAWV